MAMTCVTGGRECDGCGNCQENHNSAVGICCDCGEPIVDGIEYLNLDGRLYCELCLYDMPAGELLRLLGYKLEVA